MARDPRYGFYLRMAVEEQEKAYDAERAGEAQCLIATYVQRAISYRTKAEAVGRKLTAPCPARAF